MIDRAAQLLLYIPDQGHPQLLGHLNRGGVLGGHGGEEPLHPQGGEGVRDEPRRRLRGEAAALKFGKDHVEDLDLARVQIVGGHPAGPDKPALLLLHDGQGEDRLPRVVGVHHRIQKGADRLFGLLLGRHVQEPRRLLVGEEGAHRLEVLGEVAPDDEPLGLDGGWDDHGRESGPGDKRRSVGRVQEGVVRGQAGGTRAPKTLLTRSLPNDEKDGQGFSGQSGDGRI